MRVEVPARSIVVINHARGIDVAHDQIRVAEPLRTSGDVGMTIAVQIRHGDCADRVIPRKIPMPEKINANRRMQAALRGEIKQ